MGSLIDFQTAAAFIQRSPSHLASIRRPPNGSSHAIQFDTFHTIPFRTSVVIFEPIDSIRVYPGRVTGRDLDHLHPGGFTVAGGASVARNSTANQLHEQYQADWLGDSEL